MSAIDNTGMAKKVRREAIEIIDETKDAAAKIAMKHDSFSSMSTEELKKMHEHLMVILCSAMRVVDPYTPIKQIVAVVHSFDDIAVLLSKRSDS
jgi:hypothetical protein